ncbi:MAG: peptidoglycan bridge formation glycyltransferase FemA/FemB family protein [Candidatus Gracilibacteria bacterium]|nr:peptidoglycan bridge formation glycyltransferase FemA/FemB family protein [Candidatus Gracilibacteria bacterium]
MFHLEEIKNKNYWNDFVVNNFEFYSFLDSWEWGEMNELEDNKIFRFGIFENEKQVGIIMLIKVIAKRGTYFLSPHSPLIKGNYFEIFSQILPEIKKIADRENISFLRVNGVTENTIENLENYKKIGFIFAPMHAHAEETHLLDLTKTEEELLKNMRSTTRYIINRAKKEGVQIIQSNDEESINKFIELHLLHAGRTNGKHKYHAFTPEYVRNLFKVFNPNDITCMKAIYNNFVEASLVTVKFGKNCVYYLGASDIKNPKFSPAYLVQWEAIKKAKNDGCTLYNFWGVAPEGSKGHPLDGVSLFKRGFGGYDYYLTHAHDYPFNKKYWITYIIETIRRIKRGYFYIKPTEKS